MDSQTEDERGTPELGTVVEILGGCPLRVGTPVKSLELLECSELGASSVTNDVLVGNCRYEAGSLWTYARIWTWYGIGRRSDDAQESRRAVMAGFTPRRIFTAVVRAGGISTAVSALVA